MLPLQSNESGARVRACLPTPCTTPTHYIFSVGKTFATAIDSLFLLQPAETLYRQFFTLLTLGYHASRAGIYANAELQKANHTIPLPKREQPARSPSPITAPRRRYPVRARVTPWQQCEPRASAVHAKKSASDQHYKCEPSVMPALQKSVHLNSCFADGDSDRLLVFFR